MPLPSTPPSDIRGLFPRERAALLELLLELAPDDWLRPTVCSDWNVKAVALHILDDDLGWLSRGRDGDASGLLTVTADYRAFVEALDDKNQRWIDGAIGLSPRLICELLAWVGGEVDTYYTGLDLSAPGGRVSWAGPARAPVWLNLGRDFTERWVHQQQIRDAVDRPGLKEAEWLGPVLRIFMWALPHHYRNVNADPGNALAVNIIGPGGGRWTLTLTAAGWDLQEADPVGAIATVQLSSDDAWRLFSGALPDTARVYTAGEGRLTTHFLGTRSIIV